MTDRMLVRFRGEGCGVGEPSWGQRELRGGMVEQRRWFPIGATFPARPGSTVADVAADLGFLVGRHQSMRTRLRFGPNRWPLQVVEDVPDTIGISLWADTRYTGPADVKGFLLTMESALVDAAFDPAAPTRVPVDRAGGVGR